MKGILKWPLIVAAVAVVLRVVAERSGVPESVTKYISVVALHLLIAPVYFAIRIGRSGVSRPYIALIKSVALYVLLARAMIIPTYWLARIFSWQQSRFGGLAGATPLVAYVVNPFATAAFWIVFSICVGGVVGSIVVAVTSRFFRDETAG